MQNPTQKQIVMEIVKNYEPLRTEQVERKALSVGISGGSAGRYLRYLQEEEKIKGYKEKGDRTKTWITNGVQKSLF